MSTPATTATALIRTVTGDLDVSQLGRTDAHEHVFLSSPLLAGEDFQDLGKAIQELETVRDSGIDALVDLTTIGLGRRPAELAKVAQDTGLHIVAATGYHRDAHYRADHWIYQATADQLLRAVVSDIEEGMDASDWSVPFRDTSSARAGVIKAGASYQLISRTERERLEICVEAAVLTGVPLAVHTEVGTSGHQILDVVESGGLPASRVMLAHLDRNPDPDAHEELMQRGAFLVYDTVGRIKYRPESALLDLVAEMVERGFAGKLMLGTDVGRRNTLRAYGGGPGMDVLGRDFVPRLVRRIGVAGVDALLVDTPAAYLRLEGVPA
ncbi:phosphotriesterase-related protein [Nakamurella sp. UYEF19]|uniref:phosphotriesterase family protein n=1 Tax=Nakamurella sp. UYEF19 TaxID=1756392 RepID=UPI003391BAA5